MAEQWWQLDEAFLASNAEAQAAKQLAYYQTFYGSRQGREVLLDVTRLCSQLMPTAEATMARVRLLDQIKVNCGIGSEQEMAAIEAESRM